MNWRRMLWGGTILGFCIFVLLQGPQIGIAQHQTEIGTIDLDDILNAQVLAGVNEPLEEETARLQKELDEAIVDKSEAEKQQIFDEYQAKLFALQQELVDNLLHDIRNVIAEVAEDTGLDVVLDASSVMYGGVDVTDLVLQRLEDER